MFENFLTIAVWIGIAAFTWSVSSSLESIAESLKKSNANNHS